MTRPPKNSLIEKTAALIDAIRSALRSGVKHYDKSGRLLETEEEILTCLTREGAVRAEGQDDEY